MDFNQIPVLARGSHDGDGYGCAMNLVSWINGDEKITDFPSCVHPNLAEVIQFVNDQLAGFGKWAAIHDGPLPRTTKLVPPEYAPRLTELAIRSMGTNPEGLRPHQMEYTLPGCVASVAYGDHVALLYALELEVERYRAAAGLGDATLATARDVAAAQEKMAEVSL